MKPTLVNPLLFTTCYFSKEIHKKQWERINFIKDELNKGEELESFSEYKKWEIPKDAGYLPVVQQVLEKLKPGQTYDKIWEDEFSFAIPRLLKRDEKGWKIDGVVTEKEDCSAWLVREANRLIEIKWQDKVLAEKIKRDYPDWWKRYEEAMTK